jgi:hypothetical protein
MPFPSNPRPIIKADRLGLAPQARVVLLAERPNLDAHSYTVQTPNSSWDLQ